MVFSDRKEAGEQLAGKLAAYADRSDVVVLSILPGGVPIGFQIARRLNLTFDVLLISKIFSPYNSNYQIGAATLGDNFYFDGELINSLKINRNTLESISVHASYELQYMNEIYRGGKDWINLEDKFVILADDGGCYEEDLYLAMKLIEIQSPHTVVLATPVICNQKDTLYENGVENLICLSEKDDRFNVNNCYTNFPVVTESEIKLLFERTHYCKLN
jgi:putative phosphoribosyl transferase